MNNIAYTPRPNKYGLFEIFGSCNISELKKVKGSVPYMDEVIVYGGTLNVDEDIVLSSLTITNESRLPEFCFLMKLEE